jgi:DHA2 family multidrug resistance protein
MVMSFGDVFLTLTLLFSCLVVLSVFIKRPNAGVKVEAH